MSVRDAFWSAVDVADQVLTSPRVAARWDDPSALPEMSVGAVAAHLVRALTTVETYLARPAPRAESVSAATYFWTVLGDPSDLASAQNTAVRDRAHHEAEGGPGEVTERWEAAATTVREKLASEPLDRLVTVADELVLEIDDYLATRVVELLMHTDDLAVSVGTAPPDPPPEAARLAELVLLDLARLRHGDLEVLRALARRERSSAEILRVL